MLPLGFLIAATGVGAIGLAIVLIYLGNQTFHVCPNCKGKQLVHWTGKISPENEVIWAEAKAVDDKAFKTNKLILLGIVMVMFVAAIAFVYLMQ